MNLEVFIDNLIEEELQKKEDRKLQKKCETAILYGQPNGLSYRILNFKKPLKDIAATPNGKATIQRYYNDVKSRLAVGEEIFNKNLEELGIKL